MKPPPLYVKVLENTDNDQQQSVEDWCSASETDIDCSDPPRGQTCVLDVCAIDHDVHAQCRPVFVRPMIKSGQLTLTQMIMVSCMSLTLFFLLMRCIYQTWWKKREDDDQDSSDEIEEKKIFNTAENMKDAQVAIENLLKQLNEYEQNLDVNRKYHRDIHNERYYDDSDA